MNKLIVRIRGGLGNQLFGYAFGRKISIETKAILILDGTTSFVKYDKIYKRFFELDKFKTKFTLANNKYQLHPFEKIKRNILKCYSYFQDFEDKIYIENFKFAYDSRFNQMKSKKIRFLDGMWQSEKYFSSIKSLLQNEIDLKSPFDNDNRKILKKIYETNSVSIHIRFFDKIESDQYHNLDAGYYSRSINKILTNVSDPVFFIFSDNPNKIKYKINTKNIKYHIVDINKKSEDNYKDLILMKNCKHNIIANSTFSWWAAWLNKNKNKIVICPKINIKFDRKVTTWGFDDQLPIDWIKL